MELQKAQKIGIMRPSSGFIWGIPAKTITITTLVDADGSTMSASSTTDCHGKLGNEAVK